MPIPIPAAGDEVVASWGGAVASALNGLGFTKAASGSVQVSSGSAGAAGAAVPINYAAAGFTVPPIVLLTGQNPTGLCAPTITGAPTLTTVSVVTRRLDAGNVATFTIWWLALGS